MEQHRNGHEDGYQPELVAVSPNRPPQFNESSCGFRCGWGCCEPSGGDDDGGGSESNTPTLVPSDDDEEELPHEEYEVHPRVGEGARAEFEEMAHLLAYAGGNLHQSQLVVIDEDLSVSSAQYQSFDDAASVEPEASSGTRSVLSLDGRSIELISPDALIAAIGHWAEDIHPDQIYLDYTGENQAAQMPPNSLFRVAPLRLSPQYEHCRGSPYSHMVLPAFMMEY